MLPAKTMTADVAQGPRARRLQAAESASRLLAEAGIDQTRQVDVFGLCEQVGLWLAFRPLDGLLGSYLPEGSGGVLITTQRPVSIQRYTAAHELGHWRLLHGLGPSFDTEEQVLGDTPDESEQLAQVFAASLLMPPPLVFGTLARLGGAGRDLSPADAYMVAREAGVSYEAAVRQLANLDAISDVKADELLRIRPLKIKTTIGRGRRPLVGTADVWPVDEKWHGYQLTVHADDELVISLPENRSTGYRWFFEGLAPSRNPTPEPPTVQTAEPSDRLAAFGDSEGLVGLVDRIGGTHGPERTRAPRAAIDIARAAGSARPKPAVELSGAMTLVGDRYMTARAPEMSGRDARRKRLSRLGNAASGTEAEPRIGGTGRRILNVRLHRPGPAALRLKHQSAFGSCHDEIDGFALDVDVKPRRRGMSIDQLLTARDSEWAEPIRERQRTYAGLDPQPHTSSRETR